MRPSFKFLSLLIIAVLLLGGGWYLLSNRAPQETVKTEQKLPPDEPNTKEINGAKVTLADPLVTGSKLPVGFPHDIPVEQMNVTEGFRSVYPQINAVQYAVTYTSNKSRDALWDVYNSFANGAGFTISANATSKTSGQLSADKNNDTLFVVISTRNGASLVQISFLDRQQ